MTLRVRTLLLVTGLLVVGVGATAAVLGWASSAALIERTRADGELIARLLARSAEFADELDEVIEGAADGHMVVEASLVAQLVALGEEHGASTEEIAARLREVIRRTALDEVWVTDETGRAYLHTVPDVDFRFSPDPHEQPQASAFWPLLTGDRSRVAQRAERREVDDQVFKYVGVGGVDRPRIVQVGYNARFLGRLRQGVGLSRLVQELVAGGNVVALSVIDPNLVTLAFSAVPGREAGQDLAAADIAAVRQVIQRGGTVSYLAGQVLTVITPIIDTTSGRRQGAAIVQLPAEAIFEATARQVVLAGLVALTVVCLGVLASSILARRVTQPVAQLTAAAAAIEASAPVPASLGRVGERRDELGQLARVFQRMADEVYAREERLQRQLQALQIEIDETKKAQDVAQITESAYFQQARERVRARRTRPQNQPPAGPPLHPAT
jgi:hypothetical protein